jgi:hemerythrin-like metal-binding protein
MTPLTWSDALALDHPQMDRTHEEFVALLADAATALPGPDAPLLQAFDAMIEHTIEHFAQEERWMAATGFAPENCHAFQHQAVLGVMTECARRARDGGDFEPLRLAVDELAIWFPQHAQMMDAALAQHLANVGFDPATGQCATPLPQAEAVTGCGSQSCG